ncbi:sugar phosphotransferase [Leptospira ryugenii]|uniref:sugar phosphotransferase n=1 Tax=Leptospira ryugenii TaxID=1917863 RepID=UPI000D599928|nr:sugar phosphotransferase [Leptospira ryugenii]
MSALFLVLIGSSFLLSILLHTFYVFSNFGIQDIPNERSLHTERTKKSGGMVFIPCFLISVFLWLLLEQTDVISFIPKFPAEPKMYYFIFGLVFFCMLGFFDDIFHLTPIIRLLLEYSVVFYLLHALKFQFSLFGIQIGNEWIHLLLGSTTIVFFINLINFMDGLDLYLVGTLALGFLFLPVLLGISFQMEVSYALIPFLFCVSLSGFAFYNYPKAKLFMGDSGSLSIGFFLAFLPLCFQKESLGKVSDSIFIYFFLSPTFWTDGLITLFVRAIQKKSLFSAHREHLYQYLTELKITKAMVCLIMVFSNLPAWSLLLCYQLGFIKTDLSSEGWMLLIIFLYVVVYVFVRQSVLNRRKNIA